MTLKQTMTAGQFSSVTTSVQSGFHFEHWAGQYNNFDKGSDKNVLYLWDNDIDFRIYFIFVNKSAHSLVTEIYIYKQYQPDTSWNTYSVQLKYTFLIRICHVVNQMTQWMSKTTVVKAQIIQHCVTNDLFSCVKSKARHQSKICQFNSAAHL